MGRSLGESDQSVSSSTKKLELSDRLRWQKCSSKFSSSSWWAVGLRVLRVSSTESLAVGSSYKVAPESWVIGESKVVSSKGLEGYEMFDPRDSRREDREEENA